MVVGGSMGNPGDELVAIVDRDNRVVGSATRREMRRKALPHRSTYILVFNSRGELYVQKRTMTKDIYPGYLDPVSGGVVLAGESYEESAERELAEEMGIGGVPLKKEFEFWFEEGAVKVWGGVFSCVYDGELRLQPEEVESVTLMRPEAIAEDRERFTPDGLYVVRRYLGVIAAHTEHSLPEPVNAAARRTLAEDADDLASFERRAKEAALSLEEVRKDMKRRGKL